MFFQSTFGQIKTELKKILIDNHCITIYEPVKIRQSSLLKIFPEAMAEWRMHWSPWYF